MRRSWFALLVSGVLLVSGSAPVAARPSERLDVDLQFVLVSETLDDVSFSPDGKWFIVGNAELQVVVTGSIGETEYVGPATGNAKSITSVPDDPSLPPGAGTRGLIHVTGSTTLDPVGGGEAVACDGRFFLWRTPSDDGFWFAERGWFRWTCDNGWRIRGGIDAHFELDPVAPFPVFVLYLTGRAR